MSGWNGHLMRAVREALTRLSEMLDLIDGAREEILELARFACAQCGGAAHQALAELADFPLAPFEDAEELETARESISMPGGAAAHRRWRNAQESRQDPRLPCRYASRKRLA